MDPQLNRYLTSLLTAKKDWVLDMEEKAIDENIPIMDALGIQFVMQLIRLAKPKRILEIGTAIGYSALRMLEAYPNARIITIEKDESRYHQAVQSIKNRNKHNSIQVIHGDALEAINSLTETNHYFDCIFIDAAKGQYKRFFEQSSHLLNKNGFIISDNVLFRGYVADPDFDKLRYNKTVKKLREFNEWVVSHPDYITSIIPIGDGVAVSYKESGKGALN